MIPVILKSEPNDFDVKIRLPGLRWLKKNEIPLNGATPQGKKLEPYWTKSLPRLWESYSRICAYLAIYIEWKSGPTVDHFIPKSKNAGMAYEWKNYRLSCLGANRDKHLSDILDPIGLRQNTFILNLASGEITPNKSFPKNYMQRAQTTIGELKLNCPQNMEMRARHYSDYLEHHQSESILKKYSPFVWYEAKRQNLL